MPAGDLYMMTFKQTYGTGGKECHNVFSHLGETGSPTAAALAASFETELMPLINDIQTDTMKNVSLRVINLFSVTDFAEVILTGTGNAYGAAAETLPQFNALGYTLRISRRDVNAGSKRFAGIAEGASDRGVVVGTDILAKIELLRIGLGETLASEGINYAPVVIKRIRMDPDEDHETVWYRLPTSAEEADYGAVVAVSASPVIVTQTSRKR